MIYAKKAVALVLVLALALGSVVAVGAFEEKNTEKRNMAIDRMKKGFEKFDDVIDLSDLDIFPEELGEIFAAVTKNSPYLFYLDNNLSYTYRKGGAVVSVIPKYLYTKDEAREMMEYCKSEVIKLAAIARNGGSNLERVVILHDLICRNFSYDVSLESNNLYTFLKSGKGTCQGYTWAYMAALNELGIECEYVASDTIVHIWLRLKLDGEWYNSDVTWDDSPKNEGTGKQSRAHLLFSDAKADSDGYTDRYSASENKCTSTKYDNDDLADTVPFCTSAGDVDHDGRVSLKDLICLRIYLEKDNREGYICPICSDCDRDFNLDEGDVEGIRKLILSQ